MMHTPLSTLKLFDMTLWLERTALPQATDAVKNLVFLAEKQAAFSEEHRHQLVKILSFLGLVDYELIYQDSVLAFENAKLVLSFGRNALPEFKAALVPCITLSISAMLKDPSCKRQVLNDLKPIKDQLTAA